MKQHPSCSLACRELEYRGYDSAGISLLESNGLETFEAVGEGNSTTWRQSWAATAHLALVNTVREGQALQSVAAIFGVNQSSVFRSHTVFINGEQNAFPAKSIPGRQSYLATFKEAHDSMQPQNSLVFCYKKNI